MGKVGDNWGRGWQVLIAATSCAGLLWNCRDQHCNGLYFPDYRELKERFSNMADKKLSGPIPDGWSLEIKKKKDGSKVLSYICPGTGQCFSSYEDMMRYVIYAKNAELPIFVPGKWLIFAKGQNPGNLPQFRLKRAFFLNFPWWQRNQNAGQSSESADDQIEQNLDLDKGTDLEKSSDSVKGANIEKYLDPEKGTDIEKSLISKKGTDAKSLDSEKSADAGENLKPQNIPSDNLSAPAADTFTHEQLFFLQQIPNVPPVPARSHGEEKSPLVAIPPAMIQEFAAANPRPRPGASKPRRFRRWGHKKSAAGRYN
ncbi:hypothetical protein WN943_017687 [Citrus x changshan-huyou]